MPGLVGRESELAVIDAGANAAPASTATSLSFCSVARGVAHDIAASTSIANGRAVAANVRAAPRLRAA